MYKTILILYSLTLCIHASEPDPWWDANYSNRKRISISNSVSDDSLVLGYSLSIALDHSTLVSQGNSLASGNDLRIIYWDGINHTDLERVVYKSDWNLASSNIWFKTQNTLEASGNDDHYYVYYGYNSAGSPNENINEVFLWYDDFATDSLAGEDYTNGRSLDLHGGDTVILAHDSVNKRLSFDTGDNFTGGLRINKVSGANLLIACDMSINGTYPVNGTCALILRWESYENAFYAHISNGNYNSPAIADVPGGGGERNEAIAAAPATDIYLGSGFSEVSHIQYAIYKNQHRFWYNNTDASVSGNLLQGTGSNEHGIGVPGIQVAQQSGFMDNIMVRHYIESAPIISLGSEEHYNNFKVTAFHPFTSTVSQGEGNVQILQLVISANVNEYAELITVSSNNSLDSDVSSVSCYYTGLSKNFEATAPFGSLNQSLVSSNVHFSGNRSLANNDLNYFYIVYNMSTSATNNNAVDVFIASTNITISANNYPVSRNLSPSGNRLIEPPQSLGSIVIANGNISNVVQGSSNQEVLQIAIPVSGVGSPQTVSKVTITANNINSTDVDSMNLFYTGVANIFHTNVIFGTPNTSLSNEQATFTDTIDLIEADNTHYFFLAYNMNGLAIDGATIDAMIVGSNIIIEGNAYGVSNSDPIGNRTIFIPTGNVSNLAPSAFIQDGNPSLSDGVLFAFGTGDTTPANGLVDNLENDDNSFSGTHFDPGDIFDPQRLYTIFTYDLSSYGIGGDDLNTLLFTANLFLTGVNSATPTPSNDPAEWNTIYGANVELFNSTTSSWEVIGIDFLQSTVSNWDGSSEAGRWDEQSDSNDENPLLRSKNSSFEAGHIDSNGKLKIRVGINGVIDTTANNEAHMVFDIAFLSFSYGSSFDQLNYRWCDSSETPLANENSEIEVSANTQLHLRIGIRNSKKAKGTHYLALQYDSSASFTSPELITINSSNITMWDDGSHSEGSALSTSTVLSDSPTAGVYHEDSVPPGQSKNADTTYEEDFTLQPTVNGTYYIRVVEVDAAGAFSQLLDNYNTAIKVNVATAGDNLMSFNWSNDDGGSEEFIGANTTLEFTSGNQYLLAIQVQRYSGSTDYDWKLQYQKNPFTTPGSWTNVTTSSADFYALTTQRGSTVVNVPDALAAVAGTAISPAAVSQNGEAFANGLTTGEYSELWYSLLASANTRNNAYRFRVTDSGSSNGIEYVNYPLAFNSAFEQVSFRFADESEIPIFNENSGANISINQKVHLRIGIRANHTSISSNNLAIIIDGDNDGDFNTGGNYFLTTSSANIQSWDDTNHSDGATMNATGILSSSSGDGVYHEDENQPTSVSYTKDLIYEEDFTVTPVAAGNYYLRVVSVDDSGGNMTPLDAYSVGISLQASQPSLNQTMYSFASDNNSLSFSSGNTSLSFAPGVDYILAFQIENGGLAISASWQLEFQKTNGTPGVWTTLNTSSGQWKSTNGVYAVDADTVNSADFVCNSGNSSTTGYSAINGVYSESGAITASLNNNTYSELWYVIRADSSALYNNYRFRLIEGGSSANVQYGVYPEAKNAYQEQVSYRWADESGVALFNENTNATVSVNQQLHLRVGVKSYNDSLSNTYLAIQSSNNISFTNPVLLTTSTDNIIMWNDIDYTEGGAMSATKILSGSPSSGIFHEDNNQPSSQTLAADTLYEEDFTIQFTVGGNYFLRVVTVDSSGANGQTVSQYSQTIQASAEVPSIAIVAYEWAGDNSIPDFSGSDNTFLSFTVSSNYILAFRVDNSSLTASSNNNWLIQYQSNPDTIPSIWTDLTKVSPDWQMIDGLAGNDQDLILVSASGNALTGSSILNSQNGIYAEFNNIGATSLISGNSFTEFWFAIQPQTSSASNTYRFRLTNSGSIFGLQSSAYGRAEFLTPASPTILPVRSIFFFNGGAY